jgi:hypothetical protein
VEAQRHPLTHQPGAACHHAPRHRTRWGEFSAELLIDEIQILVKTRRKFKNSSVRLRVVLLHFSIFVRYTFLESECPWFLSPVLEFQERLRANVHLGNESYLFDCDLLSWSLAINYQLCGTRFLTMHQSTFTFRLHEFWSQARRDPQSVGSCWKAGNESCAACRHGRVSDFTCKSLAICGFKRL